MSCLLLNIFLKPKEKNYANQEDKNHLYNWEPATDDDEVLKDLMRSGNGHCPFKLLYMEIMKEQLRTYQEN